MTLFLLSRQHNIEENMTIAMEEAPESFGQVVMLYINCKVNGHPVKAFVDSGSNVLLIIINLNIVHLIWHHIFSHKFHLYTCLRILLTLDVS